MNTDVTGKRCGYCKGTGKVRKSEFGITTVACPVCGNKGIIEVPSNYAVCSKCDGTGKIVSGFAMSKTAVCETCGGSGWARQD